MKFLKDLDQKTFDVIYHIMFDTCYSGLQVSLNCAMECMDVVHMSMELTLQTALLIMKTTDL